MEKQKYRYPKVSIITVNYNQTKVTCEFLDSIQQISYLNYEVIVVDNASPTDDPAPIARDYPFVKFIQSEKNLGFAGGNNLGVRESSGEYFLFINNDTEVEKGFLEPLVETLEQDDQIGMISPKIRYHHTPDTIQYAGYTPMNPYTMRQNLVGYHQVDQGQFDKEGTTYSIHGAAMMIPRRIVEEVGLMTEIFFLYYEEHDWCARVRKAGYKMYYQSKSLVYHKESISTGKESPLKTYYISRNRILYARRNSEGFVLFFNLLYFVLVTVPKYTIQYFFTKRFDLLKPFYRAMYWNLSHWKGIYDNPVL